MVISVASFLRNHPVVLNEEESDESNNVTLNTRKRNAKRASNKSKLLGAKNYTNNMPYVKSTNACDLSDEICGSDEPYESSEYCGSDASCGSDAYFGSDETYENYKPYESSENSGSKVVKTNEDDCKEAALRLLDYAPRSVADMRQRLKEKGYDEEVVNAVIQRLLELRFLDDNQYAKAVIRSCVARMLGVRATRMELHRKNVDSAAISSCIAEAQELGMFTEAAWELGRKTAQRTKNLEPLVRRRRFFAAAARKGHDLSIISEVYNALFTNSEEE